MCPVLAFRRFPMVPSTTKIPLRCTMFASTPHFHPTRYSPHETSGRALRLPVFIISWVSSRLRVWSMLYLEGRDLPPEPHH
jgi:hypothetical protein